MGLRTAMGLTRDIATPWAPDTLTRVPTLVPDELEPQAPPMTRHRALGIPAVARARLILTSTIARPPLVVLREADRVDPQPPWPTRTDGHVSPAARMRQTIDDLLFYGESLWLADRGGDGQVLRLDRVPWSEWDVDQDGRIILGPDRVPVRADRVVHITGPHPGILRVGQATLVAAAQLETLAAESATRPFRVELHQTVDDPTFTDDDRAALIAATRKGMADNGGVIWTNAAVEARVHTFDVAGLVVSGRNAAAVDIARMCGVPAATVDATTAGASLTYETAKGRNLELVDYGLAAYTSAVAARLSQDDVVPRGQRVAFDVAVLTAPQLLSTGAPTAD